MRNSWHDYIQSSNLRSAIFEDLAGTAVTPAQAEAARDLADMVARSLFKATDEEVAGGVLRFWRGRLKIDSTDTRLLIHLLRRPPLNERCEACAAWEDFETADRLGHCAMPGAPPFMNCCHSHADDVCDLWEAKDE